MAGIALSQALLGNDASSRVARNVAGLVPIMTGLYSRATDANVATTPVLRQWSRSLSLSQAGSFGMMIRGSWGGGGVAEGKKASSCGLL